MRAGPGGLYNDGSDNAEGNSNGTVDLTDVLIDGNSAEVSGGGLYLDSKSNTSLTGCTIQNNTSFGPGPGIAYELGAMNSINDCTFGDPNQEPTVV